MSRRVLIAPSILSADFGRLAEEVRAVHKATRLPLDVHLMIIEPEKYIEAFSEAGASLISVHVEACPHLHRTLQQIRHTGAKPSAVLNPSTPLVMIEDVLGDLEMVLLMSVNPGFGGQSFILHTLDKVRRLRRML